ncbi:hypothetical protein [Streptacidiphilus sp. EB129]|uniref:hypothetical protein n=1 Tax=Streptacidiphilus sp. EB129 TaxID=3156262 RepID=UPI003515E38D
MVVLLPAEVGSGVVNDWAARSQIEIDVVVLAGRDSNAPRRILSLGEAKLGVVIRHSHVQRLECARELFASKGYDTRDTVLACYSGAGFTQELRAERRRDLALTGLDRLCARKG